MIVSTISIVPTISTLSEIPESIYNAVQAFLASNPEWDHDRLMSTSIASFLASREQET